MKTIAESELILNAEGSVYHLDLLPGDIAATIITVGDPERVGKVSRYFDSIQIKKSKREFVTHTGTIGGKRLTVISTGIGTDNIEIILNELDTLVNIDLKTRLPRQQLQKLNIIRIGTSGAVQADIAIDSLPVSSKAFGMDALMHYYKYELTEAETQLLDAFNASLAVSCGITPYIASADQLLIDTLAADLPKGITNTVPGFYAPQGRQIRALPAHADLMNIIQRFSINGQRITNLEMETAGIYGLSATLGHRAISFNVILANRATRTFSKRPEKIMDHYIKQILARVANIL